MARGGGGKGIIGVGGRGSVRGGAGRRAGAATRAASRATRNATRRAERKAASRATKGASEHMIERDLGKSADGLVFKARNRLNRIAKRASQMKNNSFRRGERLSTNREIQQEVNAIARTELDDEIKDIGLSPMNDEREFTKRGIFIPQGDSAAGQKSLLMNYAGPEMSKAVMSGATREKIIEAGIMSHDKAFEAIGQSIKDLADMVQNIRDGINYTLDNHGGG